MRRSARDSLASSVAGESRGNFSLASPVGEQALGSADHGQQLACVRQLVARTTTRVESVQNNLTPCAV